MARHVEKSTEHRDPFRQWVPDLRLVHFVPRQTTQGSHAVTFRQYLRAVEKSRSEKSWPVMKAPPIGQQFGPAAFDHTLYRNSDAAPVVGKVWLDLPALGK